MTDFLNINGLEIPVLHGNGRRKRGSPPKGRRFQSGSYRRDTKGLITEWEFKTPVTIPATAAMFEGLINGRGHNFTFDAHAYSGKGLKPSGASLLGAAGDDVSINTADQKFGDGCLEIDGVTSAGAYVEWDFSDDEDLRDWSVVLWFKNDTDGDAWKHLALVYDYDNTTLTKYIDGTSAATIDNITMTSYVLKIEGRNLADAADKKVLIDDLTFYPFQMTEAWIDDIVDEDIQQSDLPYLDVKLDSHILAEKRKATVLATRYKHDYIQMNSGGTFYPNSRIISFSLAEQKRNYGKREGLTGVVIYPDVLFGSVTSGHIYDSEDNGATWTDQGAIVDTAVFGFADMTGGIILAGAAWLKKIWRSIDRGKTWADMGVQADYPMSAAFVSGGIAVVGCKFGHILRTTDYGVNWVDLGDKGGGHRVDGIASFGSSVVVAVTSDGKTTKSTDSGATWGALIDQGGDHYDPIISLGSGVGLIGENLNGLVIRTADSGANWASVGALTSMHKVRCFCDFDGGVVMAGASNDGGSNYGALFRSEDDGATWGGQINVTTGGVKPNCFVRLGGSRALAGYTDGHIWETTDSGASWSDLGDMTDYGGVQSMIAVSK